ncbi:MAG TPA: hypothetical protein VGM86_29945 [Thermoanaerobaculia bacterium]
MAEEISAPVATCPNPSCGKPIPRGHPYSWCAECGQELPAEIQARLPRLRENEARAATARAALTRGKPYVADEAEAIAKLYRRLVLLVGSQLLLAFLVQVMPVIIPREVAGVVVFVVLLAGLAILVASILMVVTAYRLAGRLQSGPPILWAVAMFLPCISILTLLALSASATSWCRQHGIKVGFFGPTRESIEEIRRSSVTSAFD